MKRFLGNKLLHMGTKIVAVGRNYAGHAKEMRAEVPKTPVMFLKPVSSIIHPGDRIVIPGGIGEVHHEVELGVVIGRGGRRIAAEDAMAHVAGYVVALDLTARDLQAEAKAKSLPWTVSKGYDGFCPVSDFLPAERLPDPQNVELWVAVDGKDRQRGRTSDMIFPVAQLIRAVSEVMTLGEGDIILTGTPEGVGPIAPGQVVTAGITGLIDMRYEVVAEEGAR